MENILRQESFYSAATSDFKKRRSQKLAGLNFSLKVIQDKNDSTQYTFVNMMYSFTSVQTLSVRVISWLKVHTARKHSLTKHFYHHLLG
jgi:hypothetical protein